MVQAEIKTPTRSSLPRNQSKVVINPLHNYSSYMCNFTLAAVRKTDANEPMSYMEKLDLIILKTGGKGTDGLSTKVSGVTRVIGTQQEVEDTEIEGRAIARTKNIYETDFTGEQLVENFNAKSPGRFDMFIDNVEVETIMGPNEASGATTATSIKFDVIEPYSINGFIEALHVSAVAAGYLTYTQASYVLKMEFKGYPYDKPLSDPEVVPNSTRYFLLGFANIEVDITEKGTRYKCRALPFNEKVLGQPNVIKAPISMSGNSVQDILKSLFTNLNNQISNDDKKSKSDNRVASKSDTYEVKFPTRNKDGSFNYNEVNEIGKANLISIDRSNKLFRFTDPGDKSQGVRNAYKIVGEPTKGKETPETAEMQVQFRENSRIHEIITSIIRDSEYLKNKLKNLKQNLDEYGFLDYFMIKTEVKNSEEFDTVTRKPFQNYTYTIIPYKIHFTRIPEYASQKIDVSNYINIVLKDYNYIYTGQNSDITNFKINFNSLYFEAIPRALADNDQPSSRFSDAERTKSDRNSSGTDPVVVKKEIVGTPMLRASDLPTSVQQRGGNASQPSDDPYQVLARNMHEAVVNSQASMVTGELDIIGDPFYLIQGGIGNYNPKYSAQSERMNELGDANHLYGEVLIRIIFKNPVGIQSLADGGLYAFNDELVPFAGIYRVNKVQNTFSDGVFKQRLFIIRMHGQIIDNNIPTDPTKVAVNTVVKEEGLQAPSPTDEQIRANNAALANFPG